MEVIPWVGDLGPTALVALAVWLILTGRLVPRKTLEKAEREAEHWRHASESEAQARRLEAQQNGQMIEALALHTRLLESIRDRARDTSSRGGDG